MDYRPLTGYPTYPGSNPGVNAIDNSGPNAIEMTFAVQPFTFTLSVFFSELQSFLSHGMADACFSSKVAPFLGISLFSKQLVCP